MKLCIENISGIKAVKILQDGEETPSGYLDKTNDLLAWKESGEQATSDFLQFQSYVEEVADGLLWSSLTNEEKEFLIDYYLKANTTTREADNLQKITYLITTKGMTQAQAEDYLRQSWANYHIKEIESCKRRSESKEVYLVISTYLSFQEASDFVRTIETPLYMYATQGIRGIEEGNTIEGLFDFIQSTPGTIYETAGLNEQGYTMLTGDTDVTNFKADLLNVLRLGNYAS